MTMATSAQQHLPGKKNIFRLLWDFGRTSQPQEVAPTCIIQKTLLWSDGLTSKEVVEFNNRALNKYRQWKCDPRNFFAQETVSDWKGILSIWLQPCASSSEPQGVESAGVHLHNCKRTRIGLSKTWTCSIVKLFDDLGNIDCFRQTTCLDSTLWWDFICKICRFVWKRSYLHLTLMWENKTHQGLCLSTLAPPRTEAPESCRQDLHPHPQVYNGNRFTLQVWPLFLRTLHSVQIEFFHFKWQMVPCGRQHKVHQLWNWKCYRFSDLTTCFSLSNPAWSRNLVFSHNGNFHWHSCCEKKLLHNPYWSHNIVRSWKSESKGIQVTEKWEESHVFKGTFR